MKTTKHLQIFKSYVKTSMISVILMSFSLGSSAENPYLSVQISRNISGSGLGGNICPALALTFNKNSIAVGPNFQRQRMNLSGMQLSYRYAVATNANQKLEMFFSGNFTFQTAAYMSHGNADIEESSHPEATCDYDQMRLKVIEGYAGIGLKYSPGRHLSAAFSTGIGAFNTLDKNYDREMYRQKSAMVLQLKFTLSYNFKMNAETKKAAKRNLQKTKM